VLFTGGKDSMFAFHISKLVGHEIECISAVKPKSPDSMLYHSPGIEHLKIYGKAIGLPLFLYEGTGNEELDFEEMLKSIKLEYNIDGVATGAIDSDYQFIRFQLILRRLGLKMFAPLWHKDQEEYMRKLPKYGFKYIITKISALGIPHSLLGKEIDDKATENIINLSKKYGFNPAFEGGEAETMVLDAPLMRCKIDVKGNIIKSSEFEWYYSIYDINCLEKRQSTME
jgi:ABC transporter with metal-binding/Fe-S-binding domain ATP-binding protein